MRQKGLVKLLVNLKFCEETFIRSKRNPISLSFFEIILQRREFSCIEFNLKASISCLYMLSDDSFPFSIYSIVYSFELRFSFTRSNSSLRESIFLGSDELNSN